MESPTDPQNAHYGESFSITAATMQIDVVCPDACDLEITKKVSDLDENLVEANTATLGETLTYTINYENIGDAVCTGTGVKIYDPLHDYLTYVADSKNIVISNDGEDDDYHATQGNNYNGKANILLYNVNRVSPGESGVITFQAEITEDLECGEYDIPNKAKIWSDQTNYIWSNQVDTHVVEDCTNKIYFDKVVVGGGPGVDGDWEFKVDNRGSFYDGDYVNLPANSGPYSVTESSQYDSLYTLTDASGVCSLDRSGNIVMNVGDTGGRCIVENTRNTGDLTIIKAVDSDGDGEIDFHNTGWTYDINSGNQNYDMGTTQTLVTGKYSVSEDQQTNYHSIGWRCTDGTSGLGEALKVEVTTEDITCIFANTRDTGDLTIIKAVDSDGDGDVDFHNTGWTYDIDAGNQNYAMGSTQTLVTGNYTVNEDQQANYHSIGWRCTDGTSGLGEILNVEVTTQGVTCTFANTRDTGDLKVNKKVDLNGDGEFTIGNDGANRLGFMWGLDSETPARAMGSDVTVVTGSYSVTENDVDGYHFVGWYINGTRKSCEDPQGTEFPSNFRVTTDDIEITLCNAKNTGDLTIIKAVDSDGDGNIDYHNTGWTYDIDGGNQNYAMGSTQTLSTGNYTVNEDQQTNYHSIGWRCTDGTSGQGETLDVEVTTQGVTCTFANSRNTGDLLVNKKVDTDGDGIFESGNGRANILGFMWDIDSETPARAMGSTEALVTGNYTVNENSVTNYHFAGWYTNVPGADFSCENPQGTSLPVNVSVTTGNLTEITFCNARDTGDLRIKKYNDLNGDGIMNGADYYMTGWHFDVFDGGQFVADGNTGEDGDWLIIENLPTGSYDVVENLNIQGWINTEPGDGTLTKTVTITDGGLENVRFGNFELGEISGKKWNDLNGNGIWNIGEPTLAGWTIELLADDMTTVLDTDVTDGTGEYTFTGLTAGTYYLNEVQQAGWTQTFPSPGQILGPVDVTSGTDVSGYNFGNFENIDVTVCKYIDENGDGSITGDPVYTAGWNVYLDTNMKTTWGDGCYTYTNVGPGSYTVSEEHKGGWTQTYPTNSDHYDFGAVSGQNKTYKFGNFEKVSISGQKFEDFNGNGTKDAGDTGLAGWTIQLLDTQDNVLNTTVTNGVGLYSFDNLTPGTYRVREVLQTGWIQTTVNPADITVVSGQDVNNINFGNFDNINITVCKYIDVNGDGVLDDGIQYNGWMVYVNGDDKLTETNGCVTYTDNGPGSYHVEEENKTGWLQTYPAGGDYSFEAVSGDDVTLDFGNFELGKISGHKFEDVNGNGTWDPGEPALENWTIYISGNWATSTQTFADGSYEFTNLTAGDWTVTEDESDTDWIRTTANPALITINSGDVVEDVDFGNFELGKISGYKMDTQEAGLENWKICLDSGPCTFTDENGYYEFADLTVGTYVVSETQQYGWTQIWPDGDGTHSVDVVSGTDSQDNDFMNRLNEFEVVIIKTAQATVVAGDQMTYTLNWGITGNTPVFDAYVSDVLPVDTTFVSSPTGVYDDATRTITWDLGTVTPNDAGVVTFVVEVASPLDNDTVIENTGDVCGTGYIVPEDENELFNIDGTTKCDSDTTTTTVESEPILGIEKVNDRPIANPGDTVNYTVYWSVDGNSKATNVTLIDTIPVELTIDVATISDGGIYDDATRTITWDLGTQVPHAEGFVTYSAAIESPLADGTTFVNIAKITSDETDPIFWEDDSVVTVVAGPILTIVKSVDKEWVNPGDVATYTVTVANIGNDTAYNVQLDDLLPVDFTFVDYATGSHTWDLGDMEAGSDVTVTFVVVIGDDAKVGVYDNLAIASADNHGNVDDTAPLEVRIPTVLADEADPVLEIVKTSDKEWINPGDTVTYTVKVTNVGEAQAEAVAINVQVQDVLPAGFTFEDGTVTKVWPLGDLLVGESREITYTAISDDTILPGLYENLAAAWADNHDKISDTVDVDVRLVEILGAEELPITGGSLFYFLLASLVVAFSAYVLRLTFSKERS